MPPDPDPGSGPQFDPTDPVDLESLCSHLLRRSGRTFAVPLPFEWPIDAGDPNDGDGWQVHPEDPAVRHYDRATRTIIDISFPGDDNFRLYGWVLEGAPPRCRTIDRIGRYFRCGPLELAEALSAILHKELSGDS